MAFHVIDSDKKMSLESFSGKNSQWYQIQVSENRRHWRLKALSLVSLVPTVEIPLQPVDSKILPDDPKNL